MSKYKTLCIDLMETLIKRDDDFFYEKIYTILSKKITISKIKNKVRQKYLEYSMGNYQDDTEYIEVILMTLLGETPATEMIQKIRSCMLDHYVAIDGSIDFLREIKEKGYRVVIASNFVDSWASKLIDALGFRLYVDETVISSTVCHRKPAREFFDVLVSKSGCKKNEILFIGNSFCNDYMGALKYGLDAYLLRENNETGTGMTYSDILALIE